MTICQACSTEIFSQDRFCKNCGAPAAASVEDLADTHRFDPPSNASAPAHTGSLDPNSPFFVAAPTAYPLPRASSLQTRSFIRNLLKRNVVWVVAFVLLFLFVGSGLVIGRDVVRAHRAQRAEQARREQQAAHARQAKRAGAAQHTLEDSVRNALGFTPAKVSDIEYPDTQGVFVTSLTGDDSPAALARIQAGDVLIELNDQPVRNHTEFAQALNSLKPGAEGNVKVIRDDRVLATRIRAGSQSVALFQPKTDPRDQGFLGLGDLGRRCCVSGTKRWGLEVHRIIDNSPGDLAGLQLGDLITEFDKQTIRTPEEFARRIRATKPRSKIQLKFNRGGVEQTVDLVVGHGW